ncbi:hypothetical protein ACKWTF_010189 [Chironomus riparius]
MVAFIPEDKVIFDAEYEISSGWFTKIFIMFSDSIVINGFSLRANRNIFNLPVGVYKSFPFLISFDGSRSSISNINYKHFENLKALQLLRLDENKISFIESNAFKDLYDLKNLYLHQNLLTSIDGTILSRLHNLLELSLDRNKINYVAENAFDSLTELRNLTLAENNDELWTEKLFKNNKKLKY